jgi:hypothetical protein
MFALNVNCGRIIHFIFFLVVYLFISYFSLWQYRYRDFYCSAAAILFVKLKDTCKCALLEWVFLVIGMDACV